VVELVWKNNQISNFMKNCPVGAELFIADARTADITKLRVAFGKVANAPKKDWTSAGGKFE
jgi:hypothetical protein